MIAQPYENLSELSLLELMCWREAQNQGMVGKRGVCWVAKNRTRGGALTYHDVILKPWQFSSFNENDPNSKKWPEDTDPSFAECCEAAIKVMLGQDFDITGGATFYFSPPLTEPPEKEWGPVVITLVSGQLTFCKPATVLHPDLSTQV